MAPKITQRLYNINTKDPNAKKVPVIVWEALVELVSKIEDLDMVLNVNRNMYDIESNSANEFISALAILDEIIWDNENK